MVAECEGTHPAKLTQCYGANNGGVHGRVRPFGPMNTAYATTPPTGPARLDIQILTVAREPVPRLRPDHAVLAGIVPGQGGNCSSRPPRCTDHSADIGGTDIGQLAFSTPARAVLVGGPDRVPLSFAPTPTDCPFKNADVHRAGLADAGPGDAVAGRRSVPRVAARLTHQYNSAVTEPLAVQEVASRARRRGAHHPAGQRTARRATALYSMPRWRCPRCPSRTGSTIPSTGMPVTSLKLDPAAGRQAAHPVLRLPERGPAARHRRPRRHRLRQRGGRQPDQRCSPTRSSRSSTRRCSR